MPTFRQFAALIAVSGLAACGTPQEQCEYQVSAETRNVSNLLREVEGNLARGYAWENQVSRGGNWGVCGGYYRPYYGAGLGYGSCYGGGTDVVRKRVAIDPEAEMRKRDMLRDRLAKLSQQGATYCQTRYGGTD